MVVIIPAGALPKVIEGDLAEYFQKVSSIVETSSKMGRDLVREYISSRGTAKSGKQGRIESGAMLKSVHYRRLSRTPFSIAVKFGMRPNIDYATYQENGFRHNKSGEWVDGMFAVADAREAVFQDMIAALRVIG